MVVAGHAVQVDRGDAQLGQRPELARFGDAVVVGVHPHAQTGLNCASPAVQLPVAVAVELRQRLVAVAGPLCRWPAACRRRTARCRCRSCPLPLRSIASRPSAAGGPAHLALAVAGAQQVVRERPARRLVVLTPLPSRSSTNGDAPSSAPSCASDSARELGARQRRDLGRRERRRSSAVVIAAICVGRPSPRRHRCPGPAHLRRCSARRSRPSTGWLNCVGRQRSRPARRAERMELRRGERVQVGVGLSTRRSASVASAATCSVPSTRRPGSVRQGLDLRGGQRRQRRRRPARGCPRCSSPATASVRHAPAPALLLSAADLRGAEGPGSR
jgi:hypothetical protein